MTLKATGIRQGYGSREVIRDLELTLDEGVYGLLGPNGAGKTTLLTTLATIARPQAGELRIDGHLIDSPTAARRARRRIGYLPQGFAFTPAFTVRDFLTYVAWTKQVPRAQIRSSVDEVMELVELTGRAQSALGALSGGMLQRAGIAQALVNRPGLVLLDEPTVGLDPEQRLHFRALVGRLEGTTVLLSTHLVEDVAAMCERVFVLADGQIRFAGTVRDLRAVGHAGAADNEQIGDLDRAYLRVVAAESREGV